MHLTREALDAWARLIHGSGTRSHRLWLEEGDSMVAGSTIPERPAPNIEGPAIVELVVWRDGGWSAREVTYETPESIALAASLAQRGDTHAASAALRLGAGPACRCGLPEATAVHSNPFGAGHTYDPAPLAQRQPVVKNGITFDPAKGRRPAGEGMGEGVQ